jgi:hypothetical protein
MPDSDALVGQLELIKSWKQGLPPRAAELVAGIDARIDFGERHGSWFLRLIWEEGDLSKSAELALTNAEPTSDDVSESAVVSVRSSASSQSRFVAETVYENRRSMRRLSTDLLEDWLISAVERAAGYNDSSLLFAYDTPNVPRAPTSLEDT